MSTETLQVVHGPRALEVRPRIDLSPDRVGESAPEGSPAPLRIRLVGGLEVHRAGELLGARQLGGAKPRLVLVALVLARGRPVCKDRLVEMLWGEEPPAEAVAALESCVSVLRARLRSADGRRPVVTVPHGYAVDPQLLEVDVWHPDVLPGSSARAVADASPEVVPGRLEYALSVLEGPLLPQEADLPWLREARQRHERRVIDLRAECARYAGFAGRWVDVLHHARANVETDPLDERSWGLQMRAHLELGRPVEALRSYELCRRELRNQLGCSPGPQLQQLLAEALRATDSDDDLSDLLHAVVTLSDLLATQSVSVRRRILVDARRAMCRVALPATAVTQT